MQSCSTYRVGICLAFALSIASAGLRAELTIEQILSPRFPSEPSVSPSGEKLAWVMNDRGVRNIWIAESPDFEARKVTGYDSDDGIELTNLQWCLDESAVVFVRGGAPNRNGEIPNPRSDADGAQRELWKVQVDGTAPSRISAGHSPLVHPDGKRLAFLDSAAVKLVDLNVSGKGSREAETILDARGSIGSLRWSPDGQQLAFVSARRGRSFIGVLKLGTDDVTWMSPSLDRDSDPVWSPDGKSIAFVRRPTRSETFIFAAYREGHPWAIHVADVASGRSQRIWQADSGTGSMLYPLPINNNLLWVGDRLVFPWERDGWLHLYSIPESGGQPQLMTPGEFEVEDVAVGLDGMTIYFSSNQDDLHRRHLWKATPGDRRPTQVTRGDGIQWSPLPLAGGRLAYMASDARTPAHLQLLDRSGNTRDITANPGFPAGQLVEPQPVVFAAADGMPIHAQLFLPPNSKPGVRHPAAIFFHGGSRRQMLLGWHYGSYYHNTYGFNQYLASKGYVVLSVNYRSGTGYGMEFREAENYGATGASEFNDVVGAGLYLRSRDDVDPDRIALWGGSYGGYLTALGLARASDLFACGVDIHGVHDWNASIQNFVPSYNPLKNPERAEIAFESSPLAFVDTWKSPVLLISGDDDRNVNIHQSIRLTEALRERGVAVEQLVFPDEVHGFLLYENWLKAFTAADDFMSRQMKP